MVWKPIALQLYTVRDLLERDFAGTIARVADLGYDGVELAGTGGHSAEDLRQLLESHGLRIAGSHVGIEQLEASFDDVVDYNLTLGNPTVVVPYLSEERRRTAGDWVQLAQQLTAFGHRLRDHGLKLAYHNHSFEFETFEGRTGIEILYSESDPMAVLAEVDTYWVQHGGSDPAEFIAGMPGRCPLVHLKDMTPGPEPTFAEVGSGILDWSRIFAACESAGVEWYIVEQDTCSGDPLESARKSLEWLRAH